MSGFFKSMKIGVRLLVGNGIILMLIIVLSSVLYNGNQKLWQTTESLYQHPYKVKLAARQIYISVLQIQVMMKEIALNDELSNKQILQYECKIDTLNTKVLSLFDVLYGSFLGSKSLIDDAKRECYRWKPYRDTLINLRLKKVSHKQVFRRYEIVNMPIVEKINADIQSVLDFASNKAEEFYNREYELHKKNEFAYGLAILIAILVIVIINYVILMSIRRPIRKLTAVAEQYGQGRFNVKCDYNANNEIGYLAATFNKLAIAVQDELSKKEKIADISNKMMAVNDMQAFFRILLSALMEKTDAQMAAVYFLSPDKREFIRYESIGFSDAGMKSFSALSFEGELGLALSRKTITRISNISNVNQFEFPTSAGKFKPKEIVAIPIIENNDVVAIISLAKLIDFSDIEMQMIGELGMTITARILAVLAFKKIVDYSEKVDMQKQDLETKSTELLMQSEELKEYNIELETQKKQLIEANQLKNSFLSNMSHELRTPLNSIIALSGVLNRKLTGTIKEEEGKYLTIIEKNGKQLLALINEILDLSKIESGKVEVQNSAFYVQELINQLIDQVKPMAFERNLQMNLRMQQDLPLIISDYKKLNHIIQNLLSNAIKFTETGSVEVSVEIHNSMLRVAVKDSGIGISREDLPFIFDEFKQADESTTKKYGGTGLGLAIAKKYANMLSGRIEVQSEMGVGSTFSLLLPINSNIANESLQSMKRNNPSNLIVEGSGNRAENCNKTILIVEDSEGAVIQLKDILSTEGYKIVVAVNGNEALNFLQLQKPDAIILDLMMPELDGFEILRRIRASNEKEIIPVLILTAKHISKEELQFLRGNSIDQLIQKGDIKRDELLTHLHNMIWAPKFKYPKQIDHPISQNVLSQMHSREKKMILAIEDNLDNIETLKALLGTEYDLRIATNGKEGVQMAKEVMPDLILTDISLPIMDGYKVFNALKEDNNLKHIPVVALTAKAMLGIKEELINYGFNDYISKPIDSNLLDKVIKKMVYDKG